MKLLFQSTIRHMRQHALQTILTLIVTILITAMLSAIFHFASSFQNLLRTYALNTVGNYHYLYIAPKDSDTANMLCQMAAAFKEDTWFSDVVLTDDEYSTALLLTAASPGIFTSNTMESKFNKFRINYFSDSDSTFQIGVSHNYELLASYGDLNKLNGIYSYLLVFFLMLAIISFSSILILGAVFQVSASQREQEFALLTSIGAGKSQIRSLVLLESLFYICFTLPFGFLLGIIFFELSKNRIDDLLYSLEKFPPITLSISAPFSVALIICVACIILFSAFMPAIRATKIKPIEILQKTRDVYVPDKDQTSILPFKNFGGAERWLASKSHNRFKFRYRPVLWVLSITFMLCLVLVGFRDFSTEVTNMSQSVQDYNISIDLYSNNEKSLDELTNELLISSDYELHIIREARFELHDPYPFDAEFSAGSANGISILPDVLIVSIDPDTFYSICRNLQIGSIQSGYVTGIFVKAEGTWIQNGITHKGNPYSINAGDTITLYQSNDPSIKEDGVDITIMGILDEAPLYIDTNNAMRMLILVSENDFLQLESLRPFSEYDPALHHISLRGALENAYEFEKEVEKYTFTQSDVIVNTTNYEKNLQKERASIAGFQYLCAALIFMLVLVCVCGNFTVSRTIHTARQREYAILVSVGMTPWELKKMKYWEMAFNIFFAFIFGVLTGLFCYLAIYKLYSTEYQITWHFPWSGLLLGMLVLCVSTFFTEWTLKIAIRKYTIADMFRTVE